MCRPPSLQTPAHPQEILRFLKPVERSDLSVVSRGLLLVGHLTEEEVDINSISAGFTGGGVVCILLIYVKTISSTAITLAQCLKTSPEWELDKGF